MSIISGLAEKLLRDQIRKCATAKAKKAYAEKCANDLGLAKADVERVLAWLVDKIV